MAPPGLAPAQHHRVPVGTGHVSWRRFGHGAPLVLLHGGHGSWQHWLRNIAPLAQGHTLWVPDMPGYGESSAPAEPSLAALVQALQHSLDTLVGAATPVGLAGFSFGGLVAAQLAVQRGGVTQLALLGPAAHGGARRPRGELQSWRAAQRSGDALALHTVMRHNLLLHMLHSEAAADDTAVQIHTHSCLGTRFHSRSISLAGGLLATLQAYNGPTLLAWGEHDVTATPAELLPQVLAGQPHRQGQELAGAGHWVAWEAAAQVNTLLTSFFRPA